jgi:hypothetical protein
MNFLIAAVLILQSAPYQGKSIMNLVVVGKDYKLVEIKEVQSFSGLFIDGGDGLIHFTLTLDSKARLNTVETALLPTLVLLKQGEELASIHLRDSHWEKENKLIYEWAVSPEFDDESYCLVQIYPTSEKMTTLEIPFSLAQIKRSNRDRKIQPTTIAELRTELLVRRKEVQKKDGGAK